MASDYAKLSEDPVGYVLDALWADLTVGGAEDCERLIVASLAARDYAAALMLAIALELDAQKRSVASGLRMDAVKDWTTLERYFWSVRHLGDAREIRVQAVPVPPPPPITPATIDHAWTQPPRKANPPKLRGP